MRIHAFSAAALLLVCSAMAVAGEPKFPEKAAVDFANRFPGASILDAVAEDEEIVVRGTDALNPQNHPFEARYTTDGTFKRHGARLISIKDVPEALATTLRGYPAGSVEPVCMAYTYAGMGLVFQILITKDGKKEAYAFDANGKYKGKVKGKEPENVPDQPVPVAVAPQPVPAAPVVQAAAEFSASLEEDGTIRMGQREFSTGQFVAHLKKELNGRKLSLRLTNNGDSDGAAALTKALKADVSVEEIKILPGKR